MAAGPIKLGGFAGTLGRMLPLLLALHLAVAATPPAALTGAWIYDNAARVLHRG